MLVKRKMKKQTIAIIILAILLTAITGYVLVEKISESNFIRGFQAGNEETIFQIAQQSLSCQLVPLIINNQTIKLINVDCLNQ